jgi:hypothetical protein
MMKLEAGGEGFTVSQKGNQGYNVKSRMADGEDQSAHAPASNVAKPVAQATNFLNANT